MGSLLFDDLRVLIIDEQHAMRKIVRQLLNQSHIKAVAEAESAQAAFDLITNPDEPTPDVIICALHMKNIDGMEFVSKLRRDKNMIPVLITTGDPDTFLHEVAEQAGATKVLTIPISGPDLIREIEVGLGFSLG